MALNRIIMRGNLTRDPELRYTPNGTAVCTFSLAVDRKWRAGEELKEETCYVDVVSFGKQAETHQQYLRKGASVIVDGRLQQRKWEDEDGQKRSKHEIVAEAVDYLSRAKSRDEEEEYA